MRQPIHMRGWVLYDVECVLCRWLVLRFGFRFARHGIACLPLQAAGVDRVIGVGRQDLLREFRYRTADGRVHGGGDGLIALGRHLRWLRAFWVIGRSSPGRRLMRALYDWFSARRQAMARMLGIQANMARDRR